MGLATRRLPAILTRAELAWLLVPTYGEAMSVEDEEAHDRITRALQHQELVDDLLWGFSEALEEKRGVRTGVDALLDKFSAALQTRRGKVTAAPADPAVSAVMVRINLEIGLASETLRTMLQTDKGRDMLDAGLKKLAARIVGELVK
jgi:hypothetical protein